MTVPYAGSTPVNYLGAAKLGVACVHYWRGIRAGHQCSACADFRIDTRAGSILCDPWLNPSYFGSWFVFPDNSGLDWAALGDCDYLYISHLHKDHFDPKLLRDHVNKDAVVLLPDFPVPDLKRELEKLGFHRFFETEDSVKHRPERPRGRSRRDDHRAAGTR